MHRLGVVFISLVLLLAGTCHLAGAQRPVPEQRRHIIQQDGTDLPDQFRLNMIGATCVNNLTTRATDCTFSGGGAPTDATYLTQTPNATLTAEQALSALATGLLRVTTGTGAPTSIADVAAGQVLVSETPPTWSASPSLTSLTLAAPTATTETLIVRSTDNSGTKSMQEWRRADGFVHLAVTGNSGALKLTNNTGSVSNVYTGVYGANSFYGVWHVNDIGSGADGTSWRVGGGNLSTPIISADRVTKNVGFNSAITFATAAAGVLALKLGTPGTSFPVDQGELSVVDWNGPGTAAFRMQCEEGATCTHTFGSTVKLGNALEIPGTLKYSSAEFLTSIVTNAGAYTIAATDRYVRCNDTVANTKTLPAATGTGRVVDIKNINTGSCTVARAGTDTIDNDTSVILAQFDELSLIDAASGRWDKK